MLLVLVIMAQALIGEMAITLAKLIVLGMAAMLALAFMLMIGVIKAFSYRFSNDKVLNEGEAKAKFNTLSYFLFTKI